MYLPAVVGTDLCRVCPPDIAELSREQEREAGWLAGFFDGEGAVSNCRKSHKGQVLDYRASASIVFYQGAGANLPVCERLEGALAALSFPYAVEQRKRRQGWQPGRAYRLMGNDLPLYQRFAHQVRPTKWRDRIIQAAYGAKFIKARERVVSIEPDGEEDVFALETTTGNYVVWGFASSNSAAQLQQRPAPREGGMFKTGKLSIIDVAPADTQWIRAWDFAASEAKLVKSDPDWTATVKLGFSASAAKFIVGQAFRMRDDAHEVRKAIKLHAEMDKKMIRQVIPQDPGQAGKDQAKQIAIDLAGWPVIIELPTGDKMNRAMGVSAQVSAGNVALVRGPWNDAFVEELTGFPTGAHDDWVDALSSAFNRLSGGTTGMLDYMAQLLAEKQRAEAENQHPAKDIKEKGYVAVHAETTDQGLSATQVLMNMNRGL
jgi:predicted phage terminase large subunit-like protein